MMMQTNHSNYIIEIAHLYPSLDIFSSVLELVEFMMWFGYALERDIFMGVRTCFIIPNPAGVLHVSISKVFAKAHHLLINKSFRNMTIYMSLARYVRWNIFYANGGTYRICANCMLHDDVIKWKHFPRYWPFVRGIHRSSVNSSHKSQWRGALMFTLICAWINHWVNSGEAGDLRRYRAHCDVIVMERISSYTCLFLLLMFSLPGRLQNWS